MKSLGVLKDRLSKIGIEVKFTGNYPWIYLNEVNGKRVKELNQAEHGFTIAWYPKLVEGDVKFVDNMDYVFEIIRRYR